MISGAIRIGCSGWNYAHWRNGVFYPPRLPASKWLEHYAQFFDTVEVNATFYRLPRRASVARWVEQIAARLRLRDQGVALPDAHQAAERPRAGARRASTPASSRCSLAEARADPLAAAAELQARRRATRERARAAAAGAAPRVRVPRRELVPRDVYALLREHRVALVIGDRPEVHAFQSHELTTDFTFVRFHCGHARRGAATTARRSSRSGRGASSAGATVDVYAYFNNDWEGFAPRNALRLKSLIAKNV